MSRVLDIYNNGIYIMIPNHWDSLPPDASSKWLASKKNPEEFDYQRVVAIRWSINYPTNWQG